MGKHEPPDIDQLPFDQALVQLEEAADSLEQGDIPLEQALEVYERAVGLFGHCRKRLSVVEQRLERLTEDLQGSLSTETLEPPAESPADG